MALPLTLCLIQQQPADEPPTAWSLGQDSPYFRLRNRTGLHFDHGILLAFVFPGHRIVRRVVAHDAELVQAGLGHGDEQHVPLKLPSAAAVTVAQTRHGNAVLFEGHDVRKSHPCAEEAFVQISGKASGVGGGNEDEGGEEGEENFHQAFVNCAGDAWQETSPRGFALPARQDGIRSR